MRSSSLRLEASAIDWEIAQASALRLLPRGPQIDPAHARAAVSDLRALAREAVAPVRDTTGLVADADHTSAVVDRAEWVRSNIEGFRVALRPLDEHLGESPLTALGSRAAGVQAGIALAWLSAKVLGQFEVFAAVGSPGRLLLVAPNIVAAERSLGVPSRDFRLWVCLHEETHRVQFGAVPWLAEHLLCELRTLLLLDPDGSANPVETVRRIVSAARSFPRMADVLEAVQSPEQRAVFDRLTALMSLLEGHADVVMDRVGPHVVPSVALIRERFDERRQRDSLGRRVMGMDAKLRQYTEGAAFVRKAIDLVGLAGFNRVWSSPDALPTREEIADPGAWASRVAVDGGHGR